MGDQKSATKAAVSTIQAAIRRHATYSLGKAWRDLSARDLFTAVALTVRDQLVERWLATEERYRHTDPKRLYYLSMEFLLGQSLGNNLHNLGMREVYQQALSQMGVDLETVEECEADAALGNGGLGRLAACVLDSLATLGMPGYGYGIRYEYGLFKQEIDHGYQRERPDHWLAQGTPWEIARPDEACLVPIYGRVEHGIDRTGSYNPMWMDWKILIGMPYDMLIVGYGGRTVQVLRLYAACASRDFDIQIFNDGDYFKAVEQKIASETISKVLYPSDAVVAGRELRLVQEYFLVACAVRDIVRRFEQQHESFQELPAKVAMQLNDTHPALTVVEVMRLLVDEKNLPWDEAWEITQASVAYTNHTLVPEALETWPIPLLEAVLPRHVQIIYEINRRFLEQVAAAYPGDGERLRRMSLIEEASGTSNMKFALNGAITIGTLDGANGEILEEVGAENIFIFGLHVGEVQAMRAQRSYRPWEYYDRDPRVQRVVDAFRSPVFCPHEPDLFAWIARTLLDANDEHVHLADLPAYLEAQEKAGAASTEQTGWTRMAILNVARIGKFSSDRTVREYARDIWGIQNV
jgi:starch phosphorylase